MSVSVEHHVLSDSGLSDKQFSYPEESTKCGVSVCDPETSSVRWPRPK